MPHEAQGKDKVAAAEGGGPIVVLLVVGVACTPPIDMKCSLLGESLGICFSLGGQFLDLGFVIPQSSVLANLVHFSYGQGDALVRRIYRTNTIFHKQYFNMSKALRLSFRICTLDSLLHFCFFVVQIPGTKNGHEWVL